MYHKIQVVDLLATYLTCGMQEQVLAQIIVSLYIEPKWWVM